MENLKIEDRDGRIRLIYVSEEYEDFEILSFPHEMLVKKVK
jgi:hypothetical protein